MKKNIFLIANRTNSLWLFRKELILKLIKENYKVHLIASKDQFHKNFKNFDVKFFEVKSNFNSLNPITLLLIFFRILNYALKHKPDIIQSYTIVPNIISPLIAFLVKSKSICMITGLGYSFHSGNMIIKFISLLSYKFSMLFCDGLIFTNKFDFRIFSKYNLIKNKKLITTNAAGINLKNFLINFKKKKINTKKKIKFLFVGRYTKTKGIYDAIKVFTKIKFNNKELLLLGENDKFTPDSVIIKNLINKNKYIKKLKFTNKINKFLKSADLLIFTSYGEGMPTVVMESFASGLPCAVYDVAGCQDIIFNQKTGIKVGLRQHDKMAKYIFDLLSNEYKYNLIRKNIKNYSKNNFCREKINNNILMFYKKI